MANGDAALRKALAEAQAALDGLTRTNADLTRRVETAAAELRAVTDERNQLREQLAAAPRGREGQAGSRSAPADSPALAAQLAALERILAATRKELEACGAARAEQSSQLAEAQARAEASARQLEPLQAELRRATEAATRAAGEIDGHVRRAAELVAERDQLCSRAAELDKEAARLRKALADCEAAGAKLGRDNAALLRQAEGAAAQLQACAAERTALTERLKAEAARTAATAAELQACSAERERLAGQLGSHAEKLAALGAQLESCTGEREKLTAELADTRGKADSAALRLEALDTEYRDVAQARAKVEADLADCTRQSAELRESMHETATALEACRAAGAQTERRAAEGDQARVALDDRLLAREAELGLRDAELTELRERVSGDQVYVTRLKETVLAETAKASMAVQQLEAVREQHRSAIPTADLVGNLATSFDAVNRQLFSRASSYRLGRTDVTLKAFLGEGGTVAFMPDAAHLIGHPALSDISIELIPDDAPEGPPEGALVVPDVLGLTETAVIRVLSSLFLKAGKAVETVAVQEKHGRALRQIPPPGTAAVRGETVLVIYGARESA